MLPKLPRESALFLDVDGTLIPYAASPSAVHVDATLTSQLAHLAAKLGGALALLSGRRLENLDELFAPLRLPAAGLHGLQRRDAAGHLHSAPFDAIALNRARSHLQRLADATPGVRLEDKIQTLAVHFSSPTEHGPKVLAWMKQVQAELGADFQIQPGRLIYELKSGLCNKGTSLRAFIDEPPFQGRKPVMIGDDLTDLDAFRAAEEIGGIAVAVGTLVSARWHLSGPQQLRSWLATLSDE